jgi:hypothetical protein
MFVFVQANLESFVNAQYPLLNSLLENAQLKMVFDISEAQFNANAINDPWVHQFIADLTTFFSLPKV